MQAKALDLLGIGKEEAVVAVAGLVQVDGDDPAWHRPRLGRAGWRCPLESSKRGQFSFSNACQGSCTATTCFFILICSKPPSGARDAANDYHDYGLRVLGSPTLTLWSSPLRPLWTGSPVSPYCHENLILYILTMKASATQVKFELKTLQGAKLKS